MIELESYFKNYRPNKDGSFTVTIGTQELPSAYATLFQNSIGKFGYFLWKENKIQEEDVPTVEASEEWLKSPSERLRNTLYVYWEQNKIKEPFKTYYERFMEKEINKIKELLK